MTKPVEKKQPPHSLALRAKTMKMPTTPGVHKASKSNSATTETSPAGGSESQDDDISPREREIHTAISKVPLDDQGAWTKNKGPRVSALEAILGYQITEAERDSAWAI